MHKHLSGGDPLHSHQRLSLEGLPGSYTQMAVGPQHTVGPSGPLHLVWVQLLHAPPHLSRRPQVAAAGERELEGAHRALAPVAGVQGARFDGEGNMQSLCTSVSLRATIVLWYRHIQLQAASSLLQA